MPSEEQMTIEERYKYLRQQQERYRGLDRTGRGKLLDELEAITGLHRKSLVRLMSSKPKRRPRQHQRGLTYGPEVREAVLAVAEVEDWVCAERLTRNLAWLAAHLHAHGELELTEETAQALEQISTSTIRRILLCRPRPEWARRRPATSPNPVARQVAVERIPWDVSQAGYLEIDLVHHCGRSSEGEYLHTLHVVDVASGWSERAVVPGRSYLAVSTALGHILDALPFTVLEAHCDNGSEFLNQLLLWFWKERYPHVRLTRSRPYHKNDNRMVEQKNYSLVRAYAGYGRLASPAQAQVLADLWEAIRLYHNAFQPVFRLQEKIYATGSDGGRTRTRHGQAETPLDRLVALGAMEPITAQAWQERRRATSLRQLYDRVTALAKELYTVPEASSPGDVRLILDALYPDQRRLTTSLPQEAARPR